MTYKKVSTSTNDIFAGRPIKIYRVEVVAASTAATTLTLYDCATAGTNDFAKKSVTTATEGDLSWGSEGIMVSYLSGTLTGGGICYIYYA